MPRAALQDAGAVPSALRCDRDSAGTRQQQPGMHGSRRNMDRILFNRLFFSHPDHLTLTGCIIKEVQGVSSSVARRHYVRARICDKCQSAIERILGSDPLIDALISNLEEYGQPQCQGRWVYGVSL
eukprot:2295863-Pleurochrysis_carterae.AAC.2